MVLAVTALFTVTIVAIPLGVLAAVKRGKAADVIVSAVSYLGVSAPEFVTATVLLLLFANPTFGFLPSGGYTAFGEDPLVVLATHDSACRHPDGYSHRPYIAADPV